MHITENVSLRDFNTFRVDSYTRYFAEIHDALQVKSLIQNKILQTNPVLIIGGGSNILFTKNFPGIALKNKMMGIQIKKEDDDCAWIRVSSGELWQDLVIYAVNKNLGGIENLSLIPGTVGAAPIQNIGAYGVELCDVFEELETIHLKTGEKMVFTKSDCKFGYRDSIFKNEEKGSHFITSVTLRLEKKPKYNISYGAIKQTLENMHVHEVSVKAISDAVTHIRRSKLPDPNNIGNAGSFFKNPEIEKQNFETLKTHFPGMPGYSVNESFTKVPAGWLIEKAGWKGKKIGDAGVHKDQALVLVNYANATGKEIYDLAVKVQESVMKTFGILLTPEVNIF